MQEDFRCYSIHSPIVVPEPIAIDLTVKEVQAMEQAVLEEYKKKKEDKAEYKPKKSSSLARQIESNRQAWLADVSQHHGPALKIFDIGEVNDCILGVETGAADEFSKSRTLSLMRRFSERGEYSKLQTVSESGFFRQLDALQALLPNFKEVIDTLRAEGSIALRGDRSLQPAPILISGAPGIGKSMFAARLASILNAGSLTLRMETAQTGSQLAGSEQFWANAKQGLLFEKCLTNEYANFMVFLDEVDKVAGHPANDPLGPLYSLLEPSTAAEFRDLCYPQIALNCSRVIWILTCNDPAAVPAPIMSRVDHYCVPAPAPDQARQIAFNIVCDVQRAMFGKDDGLWLDFAEQPLEPLISLPPRKMYQAIRKAIGVALLCGREFVLPGDVPVAASTRTMGF